MKTKIAKNNPEKVNIKEIFEEYSPSEDIFTEDSTIELKRAIFEVLNETERRLILVYAELGNMRDTAAQFCCSPSLICKYVKDIREKIRKNIKYD